MTHYLICAALLLGAAESTETNSNESPRVDVSQAARTYRIHIYETYRLNREEYDVRRAAADELSTWWQDAGNPEEYEQVVLSWFEEKLHTESGQFVPQLPELPESQTFVKADEPVEGSGEVDPFLTSAEVNEDDTSSKPKVKGVLTSIGRAFFNASTPNHRDEK